MYSRDFGSVPEGGGFSSAYTEQVPADAKPAYAEPLPVQQKSLFDLSFLKNMQVDDLLIIAIGVLLLLDSDISADMILLFVCAMLFL